MTNLCSFVYRKFFSRIAIDGNSVCFPGIFCNKWLKHTFYIIVYKSVTLIIIHIIHFDNLWCDNYMIYSLFSVNMFRITVFNMDCGKMTVINMSIFSVYFQNSEICRICWLYVIWFTCLLHEYTNIYKHIFVYSHVKIATQMTVAQHSYYIVIKGNVNIERNLLDSRK